MILGIGIDTVEVARFAQWHSYSRTKLLRIYSSQEIDYCLHSPHLCAQRFAVRFAAREALYKALAAYTGDMPPFLTLCTAVTITHNMQGAPLLIIDWDMLPTVSTTYPLISLSHTHTTATALVILHAQIHTPGSF